jgi:hypothetical protein
MNKIQLFLVFLKDGYIPFCEAAKEFTVTSPKSNGVKQMAAVKRPNNAPLAIIIEPSKVLFFQK